MSRSMWLVMNVGWDYDDNYYYRSDNGSPNCLFTDRVIAENFLVEMELKQLKEDGFYILSQVTSDSSMDISDSEAADLRKRLKELGIEVYQHRQTSFKKEVSEYSDDELIEIMKIFNFNYYELVEVEIAV